MKTNLGLFALLLVLASCRNEKARPAPEISKDSSLAAPASRPVQKTLLEAANTVVVALDSGDLKLLTANFPRSGTVLFSPYGYIDPQHSKRLSAAGMLEADRKGWVLTWGNYDGTGEPIRLKVREYIRKFVYDKKYLRADTILQNSFAGKSNSLNNLKEIYPKAEFVEYHFRGTARSGNMDWSSLRLIFQKQAEGFSLVGIVHDQWTI